MNKKFMVICYYHLLKFNKQSVLFKKINPRMINTIKKANLMAISLLINRSNKTAAILPWMIWLPAAFFALYQFFLQTSISVMIAPLKSEFLLNNAGIGFLSASFYYSYTILQIPSGILTDRFGARKILNISAIGVVIACLIFSFSNSFFTASLSRTLMGVFCAPAITCAFYLASVWFSPKLFPIVIGLTEMLGMIGGASSEKILAYSVKSFGWRYTSLICASTAVVIAFFIILLVRDKKQARNLALRESSNTKNVMKYFIALLKDKQVWLVGIFSGLLFVPISTFSALWCIPFLMYSYHLDLEMAALLSSLIFIGAACGNPIVAWISEYTGKRKEIMFIGAIFSFLCIVAIIYISNLPIIAIALLQFCLGIFCSVYVIPFAIIKDITPEKSRGSSMAFTNMLCGIIGAPILQPVVGLLIHSSNTYNSLESSYKIALSVIPACLIIGVLLTFFISRKRWEVQ